MLPPFLKKPEFMFDFTKILYYFTLNLSTAKCIIKEKSLCTGDLKMGYSIGVDIGGTNVAIGIVETESAKILHKTSFKTRAPRSASEIVGEIAAACLELSENSGIAIERIDKIGVGTPGVVKDNTVSLALNLGWENEPIGEMISKLTSLPTFVANDANVAAYAEAIKGAGEGAETVIGFALGTGVGGGIVTNGKIWEGFNGFAGELGHMIIEKDGRECICGKRGCIEAYCSATALIKDTRAAMQKNPDSAMWKIAGSLDGVSGRTAFDAARAGDKTAEAVVDFFIDSLAVGVANMINIFQPDVVTVGGGISGEGENLLAPLRRRLDSMAFSVGENKTSVVCARFRNDAGIIGAALLGADSIKKSSFEKVPELMREFIPEAKIIERIPYGNGHINDTFKVTTDEGGVIKTYILQRMNKTVFKTPWLLMENMKGVTDFLARRVKAAGGNVDREVMSVYRTTEGALFACDKDGEYWRLVTFITKSMSYEKVERPEQFYMCAVAFGNFQRQLASYPAETLCETIPNFHNTPVRYENLMKAVEKNASGRAESVKEEIAFAKARREFTETFERKREEGSLPLRVTHNDTKLNNILFDIDTKEPICVVDLDTIMPGYSINDFGDSIRFGASTAPEDETDLDKVEMDIELFELYVRGFLEGTGGALTDTEISLMPAAAKMMTLECGMRFLTDYIDGDVYFKTKYSTHNLDRARNQFKLVRDMEAKMDKMQEIVNKYIQK